MMRRYHDKEIGISLRRKSALDVCVRAPASRRFRPVDSTSPPRPPVQQHSSPVMKTTTPVSIVCASALAVAGLTAYATAQAPSPSSREASAWKQVSYLKASNPGEGDEFGHTTALSDDGS